MKKEFKPEIRLAHLEEYLMRAGSNEVTDWIQKNLLNYVRKGNPEDQGEIEHIIDWMNSPKRPKRIKFMSYKEAKEGATTWVKSLTKKGLNIEEKVGDVKNIIKYKSGYRFVELVTENAYKREGTLMGHCVASYFGKPVRIISLRDEENVPHATLEISEHSVEQCKGRGNGPIHPRYINMILRLFAKLGKELNPSQMTYLGYENLSDLPEFIADVKRVYPKAKFLHRSGTTYLYRPSVVNT